MLMYSLWRRNVKLFFYKHMVMFRYTAYHSRLRIFVPHKVFLWKLCPYPICNALARQLVRTRPKYIVFAVLESVWESVLDQRAIAFPQCFRKHMSVQERWPPCNIFHKKMSHVQIPLPFPACALDGSGTPNFVVPRSPTSFPETFLQGKCRGIKMSLKHFDS